MFVVKIPIRIGIKYSNVPSVTAGDAYVTGALILYFIDASVATKQNDYCF